MTRSQPSIAAVTASRASADSRISTPEGSGFSFPGRTIARTLDPRAMSSSAMCHPRNPVAPVTLTERLFIEPVFLIHAAAGSHDAGVHVVVVFERPRHLAPRIPVSERVSMQLRNQQGVNTDVPAFGEDTEEHHAD